MPARVEFRSSPAQATARYQNQKQMGKQNTKNRTFRGPTRESPGRVHRESSPPAIRHRKHKQETPDKLSHRVRVPSARLPHFVATKNPRSQGRVEVPFYSWRGVWGEPLSDVCTGSAPSALRSSRRLFTSCLWRRYRFVSATVRTLRSSCGARDDSTGGGGQQPSAGLLLKLFCGAAGGVGVS